MNAIIRYRWRLLVLFARILIGNMEALTQDNGNLTQNEVIDSQKLEILDTSNASLAESVLDLLSMNGNKTIYM